MELAHQELTRSQKKEQMLKVLMSNTFRIGLMVWVVVFGVLYVVGTTGVSTRGYEIAALERNKTQLEHETRSLGVQIAKYRSMQSIQERLVALNMVPTAQINYIALRNSEMARR